MVVFLHMHVLCLIVSLVWFLSVLCLAPHQPLINLTPEQVVGNVLRLAKTHSGSRFMQSKLDARDIVYFNLFYEEMKEHVPDLMIDNFGHFAIEKLIALCNDEQCLYLLQRLAQSLPIVACQKHGKQKECTT